MRFPQQRFEALRYCREADGMVLMWIGFSQIHRIKFRFHYTHCVCEGNGCNPKLCPLGKREDIKIVVQPYRPRANLLPIFIRRKESA